MGEIGGGKNWVLFWWAGSCSVKLTWLSADGWGSLPPCYLFGLRWPSPGVYRLYGRVNGSFQEDSLAKVHLLCDPQNCCCRCLHPHSEPLLTHACKGDPPSLAGRYGSVFCRVTSSFPWVLVHTRFCLCPPRVESLFQPVLWKSYNQIPLTFKVRVPGDS